MKKLLFLLIIMFTLPHPATAQDDLPAWCVSVWYPSSDADGGYESILANADLIDEVNAFWYTPAPDGSLIVLPDAENADELREWREAGLTVIPSIFGSVPDVIGEALRDTHIRAIVDTVLRMDYDGIDIDYEGFPASTREDFVLFITGLSDALHAENKLLSVTVHAKTDEGIWEGARAQDWTRLMPPADIFRIMTYDYTNRNEDPGPISPPAWVLDVLAYAESINPDLSKVRMGIHFYGYSWLRGKAPATTVAYAGIQNYIASFNLEVQRDADDMEAYIDFKVTGLPRQVVYFADPIGLGYKLGLVRQQFPTLGGISIWGIGGEHPELWDVIRENMTGCV
ncbi:MAG: glycosyl hydrolase family 18 protein [Anaerolineae bacterium]|jgi:hypothetical protein|nr:glycosyl hydrolase family 18 protein [Anaerolineae bacterium]